MSKKIAPTSREPIETMGRMALMQELSEWRRVGPSLVSVARAARSAVNFWREEYDIEPPTPQDQALDRALSRLDRLSSGTGKRKGGTNR